MIKPEKIALCFFSTDKHVVNQQLYKLTENIPYEVEIWSRADIGNARYLSFSQLVNEAIISTRSEFMIFINPKCITHSKYTLEIIEGLCNGFCWVGKQSFGLFGATKELYRQIGLMDENFIGGEYEDDDFGLRLKIFGKAVKWDYDAVQYMYSDSPLGKFRGSSYTYFNTKWFEIEENVYALNEHVSPVKNLPLRIQSRNRDDISQSWLDWSHSVSDGMSHVWARAKNASFRKISLKEVRDRGKIKIILFANKIRVEFECQTETIITVQLGVAKLGEEIPVTPRINLMSNRWYEQDFQSKGEYEVRVYHDGVSIFYDRWASFPYINQIELGLSIYLPETRNI